MIYRNIYPIIIRRYWCFSSYFGMYLFLLVINKGIRFLSEIEFNSIYKYNWFICFWKDIKSPLNDAFCMNDGSSMIWLLAYYLTVAYIGKYIKIKFCYKKFIFSSSIITSVFIISNIIYHILYINKLYKGKTYLFKKIICTLRYISTNRYDGVIRVLQSISITIFFYK